MCWYSACSANSRERLRAGNPASLLDGVPLASLTNGAVLDVAAVQLQAA